MPKPKTIRQFLLAVNGVNDTPKDKQELIIKKITNNKELTSDQEKYWNFYWSIVQAKRTHNLDNADLAKVAVKQHEVIYKKKITRSTGIYHVRQAMKLWGDVLTTNKDADRVYYAGLLEKAALKAFIYADTLKDPKMLTIGIDALDKAAKIKGLMNDEKEFVIPKMPIIQITNNYNEVVEQEEKQTIEID